MIVFDYIWPEIGEKASVFWKLNVWFDGFYGIFTSAGHSILFIYILNLRFPTEYLGNNIPNKPEPT